MKYTNVSCVLLGVAVTLHPVVLNSQSRPAASNPVPFIGQPLAPARATPGSVGLTMTIRGVGFVSGSLVQWNGQALPTTFVSAESVTAVVPASDLAQAGTGVVTVVNPAPGGGSSNLAFFEVTRATPSAIMFEVRTYTPTNTNSLVAGDFNGDGKLDLAVSTGATLSILLGKGDGTFNVTTFPTTAQFVGTLGLEISTATVSLTSLSLTRFTALYTSCWETATERSLRSQRPLSAPIQFGPQQVTSTETVS